MRHVVSHALQAALGDACQAAALQRKLQVTAPPQPSAAPLRPRSRRLFIPTQNEGAFIKENPGGLWGAGARQPKRK